MGTLHCLNVGFGDASVIISDTATFLVECDGLIDPRTMFQEMRLRLWPP